MTLDNLSIQKSELLKINYLTNYLQIKTTFWAKLAENHIR